MKKKIPLQPFGFLLHMILLLILCNMAFHIKAQDQILTKQASLQMITRPMPDSVVLRWAPADYETWDLGNDFGYIVKRYTLLRDSILLDDPEKKVLTPEPLKPLELNQWEPLVKQNKYAAITAQAIYGERFQLQIGEKISPQDVYDISREQQQRRSIALYAADMSPQVAKASGLWFTDKTAKKNEKYLYRVFVPLPDTIDAEIDTAFVFTGISEYTPLPKPFEFSAEFGNKVSTLRWNIFAQNKIYMAWDIERSEGTDNNFEPVISEPFVSVVTDEATEPEYTYKLDSLNRNNLEYYYRIRGITSFGEYGPWSDTISGRGMTPVGANPNIIEHNLTDGRVEIIWEFPEEAENTISGFKISRADNHRHGFVELAEDINPDERNYLDKEPLMTGYYKVTAYRDTIDEKQSFPYLVQLPDTIPPVQPAGLKGVADTTGNIKLMWQQNPDDDLYGYRVFRSASGNDEFSQITTEPISDTTFSDTFNKKDLNPSVFYKIIAVDQRQNQSEFSETFEVIKPNIIPPSAPVITKTKATGKGIVIEWINSTCSDVVKHEISRIQEQDTLWAKLAEKPMEKDKKEGSFTDNKASHSVANQYRVVAIDSAGNRSQPSKSVRIRGHKDRTGKSLEKIDKHIDYENGRVWLLWQLPDKDVKHIHIYRKTGTSPYTMFETMEGTKTQFEDYGLKVGSLYAYRLRLVYNDGTISGFSDEIIVKF